MTEASPLAVGSVSLRLYPHDATATEQLDELRVQARLAVEAGYDGVMVSEHHGGFPGYISNPLQVAGFLLPHMPTGWAAPCPLLLPMAPYAMIAEGVAWLAAAFPGRVGAGFAAGALPLDFELAEVPFEEIGARFKEALPKVVAALRGQDPGPLNGDRAVAACAESPVPMAAAAQSPAAVRRAARLGLAVLYDSLQADEHQGRLSAVYDEAGGAAAKILIRRVWIGDPPTASIEAQMEAFRGVATSGAQSTWGQGSNTVFAADGAEAAEELYAAMVRTGSDTVNIRVMVLGLDPVEVRGQLERHGAELLPRLRELMAGSAR